MVSGNVTANIEPGGESYASFARPELAYACCDHSYDRQTDLKQHGASRSGLPAAAGVAAAQSIDLVLPD
ncbi:hypothetical protein D3C77_570170 [compost metagenome]